MALVDILTPTIPERASLLQEACASVSAQTFKDVRHLIRVDENHLGPAITRNHLIGMSTSEWVIFLDDDDLLDPEFTQLHLSHARESGADIVYSLCRYPPNSERRPPIGEFDPIRLSRGNYIPITALVRRSTLTRTSGFKPGVKFEDHRLWLDLLDVGAKFSHLPKVCWTYRIYGGTGVRYGKLR